MRILIVEDDEYKARAIRELLEQDGAHQLEVARSMRAGIQAIQTFSPEFVIMDMNLPTYDPTAGEPRPLIESQGGREVIRQLQRKRSPARVIVVTQYNLFGDDSSKVTREEMSTQLAARYPAYLGTVHYRGTDEAWKTELSGFLAAARPSQPEAR